MAKRCLNLKTKKAGGPNVTFPQLASDGATLNVYDASGNITTLPTGSKVAWSSSDNTVITVTADDSSGKTATLKSTGKVGSGIVITATITDAGGGNVVPPAISDAIDVPAGPAMSASITLGVPA